MKESEARKQIRAYIVDNFLYARPNFVFGDDDPLMRKGVVDSLGIMELIGFIEQRWNFAVPPDDITEANFGTIADIARYVARSSVSGGSPA